MEISKRTFKEKVILIYKKRGFPICISVSILIFSTFIKQFPYSPIK
jgi:hypothetical protein